MHADGDWQALEGMLTKDMATVGEHLQTWKLKLNTTKTVSAALHLNNNGAKRELNTTTKPCPSAPSTNTSEARSNVGQVARYRPHLESLRKKLTSRVALLK